MLKKKFACGAPFLPPAAPAAGMYPCFAGAVPRHASVAQALAEHSFMK